MPQDLYLKALPFLDVRRQQDYILIDPPLKAQIPTRTLEAVYSYLISFNHAFPYKKFSGPRESANFLAQSLNPLLNSAENPKNAAFRTYKINSTDYFFYTPEIWPLLSDEAKRQFIIQRTEVDSLKLTFTFSIQDDLAAIAKKYSGTRDPKILENILKNKLAQSQTKQVTVAMEDLLHPFIKDQVYHFSSCTGPNCFNSSLSVNAGEEYVQKFITSVQLLTELATRYRTLEPNEKWQTGDVLLYRDTTGAVVHAATVITEDIVFTKNGVGKFDPYIFQNRSSLETAYFNSSKFTRTVFRPPNFDSALATPVQAEKSHPVLEDATSATCKEVLGNVSSPTK